MFMLTERFSRADLAAMLLPREHWRPYPPAADRGPWSSLSTAVRDDLIAAGENAAAQAWPALPARLFLEFVRSGNRRIYEAPSFQRRSICVALVLAECAEGQQRFVDALVDAVWSLCEESFWGISAHLHMQGAGAGLPDTADPVVDLFAAETGALLSWTLYLLGDRLDSVSPLLCERLYRDIDRRVLTPCLARDDFWWMGMGRRRSLNNWTPWICSNWLTAALLTERDETRRAAAVHKACACLDRFLSQCPADGGCDEGPGYWNRAGGSAFDCLDLLNSATDGAVDGFDTTLMRNLGAYLYNVHIDGDWFVNPADAPARPQIDAQLVTRFGRAVGDPALVQLGQYALQQGNSTTWRHLRSLGRALPALFDAVPLPANRERVSAPYPGAVWLPNLQLMTARCRPGSAEGFFVAVKGGHNAESHNHNDVGNVIVFRDGAPVLVDAGVETYTAKTFSPERYTIWTMRSSYHNLPAFGRCEQIPGRQAAAVNAATRIDDCRCEVAMDIAPAYAAEAGVKSCVRTVTLTRGKCVTIVDEFDMDESGTVTLFLLTPCEVCSGGDGVLLLEDEDDEGRSMARARLTIEPADVSMSWEHISTDDRRLRSSWPRGLNRIAIETPRSRQGRLNLRID